LIEPRSRKSAQGFAVVGRTVVRGGTTDKPNLEVFGSVPCARRNASPDTVVWRIALRGLDLDDG